MNSTVYYFLFCFFLFYVTSLKYLRIPFLRGSNNRENRYLSATMVLCFLLLSLTSCKNPVPAQESIKQSDTITLAQLYFDGMKMEYLPKELKGSIKTDDFSSNAFAQETQLILRSQYFKSYVDPKDNIHEATVIIYEVSSEEELVDKIDACVEFVKKMGYQTALRAGRFFIVFHSNADDYVNFSNDKNRKIVEDFYLSKGAEIVYQTTTDEEDFYFYKP